MRRIVERFYDRIESDPHFASLRAMHGTDLEPVRRSLAGYLTAWMGGPGTWFDEAPTPCILSLHRPLAITPEMAEMWIAAMDAAIEADAQLDLPLAGQMKDRLQAMARAMINRASDGQS